MEVHEAVLKDKKYKDMVLAKVEEFNNNQKKTIIHFCDTYYPTVDGVVVVMDNYAKNLSQRYNVVVVVPMDHKKVYLSENYLVLGVKSMYFKFLNYNLAFPKSDKFYKEVVSKLKVDLIHAHSPFNLGKAAAELAKQKKVPFVMTMHSQYKRDFEKYVKIKWIVNLMVKNIVKVFNQTTEVWTMHSLSSDTLKSYGYKGDFYYVPNATDFMPPENCKELAEQFNKDHNISSSTNVFLFVGRIVSQKNVFFIVDALKILNDKNVDFRMYFIGSGPDEDALKKHIEKCGISDKVFLVGRIDDRKIQSTYYNRANLFLFPSKYDTSSLVQLEAAAHKTPGVFLENTVTAKTITNGVNGYTSSDSVEAYAEVLFNAINNKEQLETISENAFKQIYINWQQLTEKIISRYEQLINDNENKH